MTVFFFFSFLRDCKYEEEKWQILGCRLSEKVRLKQTDLAHQNMAFSSSLLSFSISLKCIYVGREKRIMNVGREKNRPTFKCVEREQKNN